MRRHSVLERMREGRPYDSERIVNFKGHLWHRKIEFCSMKRAGIKKEKSSLLLQ